MASNEKLRMDYPRFASLEHQSQHFTAILNSIDNSCFDSGVYLDYMKDMWASCEPRLAFTLPSSSALDALPSSEDFSVELLIRFPGSHTISHLEEQAEVEVLVGGELTRLDKNTGDVLAELIEIAPTTLKALVDSHGGEARRSEVLAGLSELAKRGLVALRDMNCP
jgi:hypothetical protein